MNDDLKRQQAKTMNTVIDSTRSIAAPCGAAPCHPATMKLGLAALGLLSVLGACSPAPVQVSQSSKDPSSPTAPEGVSPMIPASVAARPSTMPGTGAHDQHHQDHSGHAEHADHSGHASDANHATAGSADAAVYVCPMHPEVTSTKPGDLCPKCNMKLVPRK